MNYTKIICILDRSTSMGSIIDESIKGFNSFLKEQKMMKGEATMTVHFFDTNYTTLFKDVDIQHVEEFTKNSYVPQGMTALYDAIGKTCISEIDWLGMKSLKDRPEKTLCIILTDGQENCSQEYSKDDVKNLIYDMREDYNWEFLFLAANQDACFTAQSFGISKGNAYTYTADSTGAADVYSIVATATSNYRSGDFKSGNLINDDE